MERKIHKEPSPAIRMDDVLQYENITPPQKRAYKIKSPFEWFLEASEPFKEKPLTLLIVAEGIDKWREWTEYIKEFPEWKVECHGWIHKRYTFLKEDEIREHLKRAVDKIEKTFHQKVNFFYPPFAKRDKKVIRVCEELGLKSTSQLCNSCHFRRQVKKGKRPKKVCTKVNFHYWHGQQNTCAKWIIDNIWK